GVDVLRAGRPRAPGSRLGRLALTSGAGGQTNPFGSAHPRTCPRRHVTPGSHLRVLRRRTSKARKPRANPPASYRRGLVRSAKTARAGPHTGEGCAERAALIACALSVARTADGDAARGSVTAATGPLVFFMSHALPHSRAVHNSSCRGS